MPQKVIEKYYDDIFHYCYHHVGNREAAQDLCQETFLSFLNHQKEYQNIGKTKNYLYIIAGNKCKDYFKKHVPIPMDDLPEKAGEVDFENQILVRDMVNLLPSELKEVIILRYFQTLKYREIANILNVSTSLVKYRVKLALEQLSEMEGGKIDK